MLLLSKQGMDIDITRKYLLDDEFQRKVRIRNLKRDEAESKPIWRDKQLKTYPNLLITTPPVPLENVIVAEQEIDTAKPFDDPKAIGIAKRNLEKIAMAKHAEFILEHLSKDGMKYVIFQWPKIHKKLKEEYGDSGVDKETITRILNQDGEDFFNNIDYATALNTNKTTEIRVEEEENKKQQSEEYMREIERQQKEQNDAIEGRINEQEQQEQMLKQILNLRRANFQKKVNKKNQLEQAKDEVRQLIDVLPPSEKIAIRYNLIASKNLQAVEKIKNRLLAITQGTAAMPTSQFNAVVPPTVAPTTATPQPTVPSAQPLLSPAPKQSEEEILKDEINDFLDEYFDTTNTKFEDVEPNDYQEIEEVLSRVNTGDPTNMQELRDVKQKLELLVNSAKSVAIASPNPNPRQSLVNKENIYKKDIEDYMQIIKTSNAQIDQNEEQIIMNELQINNPTDDAHINKLKDIKKFLKTKYEPVFAGVKTQIKDTIKNENNVLDGMSATDILLLVPGTEFAQQRKGINMNIRKDFLRILFDKLGVLAQYDNDIKQADKSNIKALFDKALDTHNLNDPTNQIKGRGLRRKPKKIIGHGYIPQEKEKRTNRAFINNKYVDLNKLKDNILCVKYTNNDTFVRNLKNQKITEKTKKIIADIISEKFNKNEFEKLKPNEKRIVKKFVKNMKMTLDLQDQDDDDFERKFEILKGEYESGNSNPEIKKELKKYILVAMEDDKIGNAEGMRMLFHLSL
jgi:hypothetical protein